VKLRDIRESFAGGIAGGITMSHLNRKYKKEHGIEIDGNAFMNGLRYGSDISSDRGIKVLERKQMREGFGIFKQFARAYKEGNSATGFENPSQDMIETYDLMKNNLEEKNALGKITQEEKNTLDILNHMNNNHNIDNIDSFKSTGDKKLDRLIKGTMIPNERLTKDNINDFTNNFVNEVSGYESDKDKYSPSGLSDNTINKMSNVLQSASNGIDKINQGIEKVGSKVNEEVISDKERKQNSYDNYLKRKFNRTEDEKANTHVVQDKIHKNEDETLKGKSKEDVAINDLLFNGKENSKPSLDISSMKREANGNSDQNGRGATINFKYTKDKEREIMEDYLDIHERPEISKSDSRTNRFKRRFTNKKSGKQ